MRKMYFMIILNSTCTEALNSHCFTSGESKEHKTWSEACDAPETSGRSNGRTSTSPEYTSLALTEQTEACWSEITKHRRKNRIRHGQEAVSRAKHSGLHSLLFSIVMCLARACKDCRASLGSRDICETGTLESGL